MIMDSNDIKVICKHCGRPAKAGDYVLDPVYKMMVCPSCVKERRNAPSIKPKQEAAQQPVQDKKPAGWDAEDDLLERLQKTKQAKAAPQVETMKDGKMRYTCMRCKYKFIYNPSNQTPSSCPYCGTPVMKSFLR
jgi:DNA-directed RNA polymerase subunit RPC12/RpoP